MTPGLPTATAHIAGHRTAASRGREAVDIVNPSDGTAAGRLVGSDEDEIHAAVEEADRTFRDGVWSGLPVASRARVLARAADLVEARVDELAEAESRTTGIPLAQTRSRQIPGVAALLRAIPGSAVDRSDPIDRPGAFHAHVRYRPAGVCALITPWNSPMFLSALKLAGALAYGNSVVLKPSEYTPFGPLTLVDILEEAGVPAGVVNVVNGPGAHVGATLTGQPAVRRISFTGGNVTGVDVLTTGARRVVPVTAELGGKAPIVVLASASIPDAVDGIIASAFSTNGQQCYAGTRLIVHRDIADELTGRVVERVAALRVGDPTDPVTDIGPLAHRAHLERVTTMVDRALDQGAEPLVEGGRPDPFESGNYFRPTLLRLRTTEPDIWRDEVFGPVLVTCEAESVDHALRLAADTRFGLAAYGWAEDPGEVRRLSDGLSAGQVWINTALVADPRLPFGGVGESGIGREGATAARDFFTDPVSVAVAAP